VTVCRKGSGNGFPTVASARKHGRRTDQSILLPLKEETSRKLSKLNLKKQAPSK
jgi:hypothetical protein